MPRGIHLHRTLDRAVGVPLVWMAGKLRRRRPAPRPDSIRRIVVLQNPAIGDTVLMTGPLQDLRDRFPDAAILLVLGEENRSIAPVLPATVEAVTSSYTRPLPLVRLIRGLQPDVLIDFGTWPRINALYSLLAGARFTVGFRTPGEHRHFAYDRAVDHLASRHELLNQRALIEAVTQQPAQADPSLRFAPDISRLPELDGRRYAVLHNWASGSGKALKEWSPAAWAEVAAWLLDRGIAVTVTGSPQDAPGATALVEAIRERHPDGTLVNAAGRVELAALPALLSKATVVISVNTGVMHMAAAIGVPTIGLHGPTNPARWGPYGANGIALTPKAGRHGYLSLGYEFGRNEVDGLRHLAPTQVTDALAGLLATERV